MDHQLIIDIPEESAFVDGACTVSCEVDDAPTTAHVSIISTAQKVTIVATPKIEGYEITYGEPREMTMTTVFSIAVDGYVPATHAGYFGDEIQLSLVKKVVVPKIDINRPFAGNPGGTKA